VSDEAVEKGILEKLFGRFRRGPSASRIGELRREVARRGQGAIGLSAEEAAGAFTSSAFDRHLANRERSAGLKEAVSAFSDPGFKPASANAPVEVSGVPAIYNPSINGAGYTARPYTEERTSSGANLRAGRRAKRQAATGTAGTEAAKPETNKAGGWKNYASAAWANNYVKGAAAGVGVLATAGIIGSLHNHRHGTPNSQLYSNPYGTM
jgi:hypothetical protein